MVKTSAELAEDERKLTINRILKKLSQYRKKFPPDDVEISFEDEREKLAEDQNYEGPTKKVADEFESDIKKIKPNSEAKNYVKNLEIFDRSVEYEISIMQFMEDMQFTDRQGTESSEVQITLHLPGSNRTWDDAPETGDYVQIDAAGMFEKRLYLVECKRTQTQKKKYPGDAKKDSLAHGSLVTQVLQEMQNPCSKHNEEILKDWKLADDIISVFALKDIELSSAERKDIVNEGNKIWDNDTVEYYADEALKIGLPAMYDLLGEMEIENNDPHPVVAFCLKSDTMVAGKQVPIFQFLMDPRNLLKVATVARRERPDNEFYQRTLDDARLLEIARFLERGEYTPNNIIIGMEPKRFKEAKYSETKIKTGQKNSAANRLMRELNIKNTPLHFGTLTFPRKYRSCWVIDGQHRLYGIAKAEKRGKTKIVPIVTTEMKMPIIAFGNIEHRDMAKMFLDINDKQVKIDSDLKYDLYADYVPDSDIGIKCRVAKEINDGSSTLTGRIFYPSRGKHVKKEGKIPISTIYAAIGASKLTMETLHKHKDPKTGDQVIISNPLLGNKPKKEDYTEKEFDKKLHSWSNNAVKRATVVIGKFYDILYEEHVTKPENQNPPKPKPGAREFIFHKSTCSVIVPLIMQILAHHKKKPTGDFAAIRKYVKGLSTFMTDMEVETIRKDAEDSARGTKATIIIRNMAQSIRSNYKKNFGDDTQLLTDIPPEWEHLEKKFGRYVDRVFPKWTTTKKLHMGAVRERAKEADSFDKNQNLTDLEDFLRMDDIKLIILDERKQDTNLKKMAQDFASNTNVFDESTPETGRRPKKMDESEIKNMIYEAIVNIELQFSRHRQGEKVADALRVTNPSKIEMLDRALTQTLSATAS